jgi:hypothetical protein
MIGFYESFDEIFSLSSTKKILVDNSYLYARLHYKWFMGLDIIIKQDKPSLYKKLKELIHCSLRYYSYKGRFKTEFTVSQLKYLKKLLNLEFVPVCFKKTDRDIICEEKKQMRSKSKVLKKIESIIHEYEFLDFSNKNEQLLINKLKSALNI